MAKQIHKCGLDAKAASASTGAPLRLARAVASVEVDRLYPPTKGILQGRFSCPSRRSVPMPARSL
jgi:hypothetical protein